MSDLTRRRRARRWQPSPTKVVIAFAVNDPHTGLPDNACHFIDFPGEFLRLSHWWRPRAYREVPYGISLSGRHWAVFDRRPGYGNWCWDAWSMQIDVAAHFLLWLRQRRLFQADSGWTEIFDWFKGDGPDLPLAELKAQLIEAQREWKP